MNTKIISSGKEVILNCDFLSYDDDPCKISFNHSDVDFILELNFINNEETKNPSFTFRNDGSNFFLDLINFNGPFGHGNVEPIKLGSLGERELSLRYWVSKPGDTTIAKRVTVSVFLEGEE